MKILAFDTTSSTLSIALLQDQKILSKTTIFENGKQAEILVPEIEKILHANKIWYSDLDLIAATQGPGSFTGVRIGLTTARTLKLATGLPLILPNSLEALAFKHRESNKIIFVAIDAKMDEFFVASFAAQNGKLTQLTEPQIATLENIADAAPQENFVQENFFLCGSGKKTVSKILSKKNLAHEMNDEEEDVIEADLVGLLALEKFNRGEKSTDDCDPIYLRAPKISERKK